IVQGPISICRAGTGSFADLFKLLALLRATQSWLEEAYWPWFRAEILAPLGSTAPI
ncbi:hypothetical protein LTR16_002820, partial [Cryomyces antarcticus]